MNAYFQNLQNIANEKIQKRSASDHWISTRLERQVSQDPNKQLHWRSNN